MQDSLNLYSSKKVYSVNDNAFTYNDLMNAVNYLGSGLFYKGIKNENIAIMSENRYEWEIAYLTIVCGAGVVVPVDKMLPYIEILNIFNTSRIKTIFCSKSYKELLLRIKDECELENVICFDDESFEEVMTLGQKLVSDGYSEYIDVTINEDEAAILFYTSGTTSKSKVVALSNRNICSNIIELQKTLDVSSSDKFLSILPLHHVFECTFGFLYPLSIGCEIFFSKGIRHLIEEIKDNNITVMANVPSVYELILKQIDKKLKKGLVLEDIIGSSIRFLISGAAYLNPDIESGYRKLGLNLMQAYGLSETSPIVTISSNERYSLGSVGKALDNLKIKTINEDENGVGELLVKGDSVMLGYLKDGKIVRDAFKYGWFYTGDLAFISDDGFVFIKGRCKNVIVLDNGKNVYPEEIENLINKIDGVKESLVFNRKNKLGVKVVAEASSYDDIFEKIKGINNKLPLYKNIKDIILCEDAFIKTSTNKIKRLENLKDVM